MRQLIGFVAALACVLIVGCSAADVQFGSKNKASIGTNNNSNSLCIPTINLANRLTKIMFLIDTSGSNAGLGCDTGDTNCKPTDLGKKFRQGSIQNFFNKFGSKQNIQWGFATFAGTKATALIDKNGSAIFSNALDMQAAINKFGQVQDYDDTPYKAAMALATQAIQNDPDRNTPMNPQYIVLMITDGYPSDMKSASDVASSLSAMLATSPGSTTFNTIFYGSETESAEAISLLSELAKIGGGQFADLNTSPNGIRIEDVIATQVCAK